MLIHQCYIMQTWTALEINTLTELYPDPNYSEEEIAKKVNRSVLSVRSKAFRLHITRGIKRWKNEYDGYLKKNYEKHGAKKCAKKMGYSPRHIQLKAKELGLNKKLVYWDDGEIKKLKELCNKHPTLSEIAEQLNKSIPQLKNKMRKLGVESCWWSETEIEYLKANYTSHNANEIATYLHRTKMMVYRKASILGITQKDNSGRNHYAFKEDNREYPAEWTAGLRKKIRKRDNYQCQVCDKTQNEEGIALQVHHIDYDKENNNESNLLSLCRGCHIKTNIHRTQWFLFFSNLMKERGLV